MGLFTSRKKLHGIILGDGESSNQPCSNCDAACCKGFPRVELTADEYSFFERIEGARVEFTLTGRFFLVIDGGCGFLIGSRCGIYAHRPTVCRRFSCSDP